VRAWRSEAEDQAVATALDVVPDLIALHDRRLTGRRGRPTGPVIDHLVVAPAAVWVVDAKPHYGPLELRRSGGILTPRDEQLFINNRNRTALVEGVHAQVRIVRTELFRAGHEVEVRGALCFVGVPVPWIGETLDGLPLVGPEELLILLDRAGELDAPRRADLAAALADRFVPA
jgi:hypothetical protein